MYSRELIRKIHQSLPQELLEVITSETTFETLNSLAANYQLSTEQKDKLESEMSYRILGLTTKDIFATNIEKVVGLTPIIASELGKELELKIFAKLPQNLLAEQEKRAQDVLKSWEEIPTSAQIPEIAPPNLPMVENENVTLKSAPEIPKQEVKLAEEITTTTETAPPVVRKPFVVGEEKPEEKVEEKMPTAEEVVKEMPEQVKVEPVVGTNGGNGTKGERGIEGENGTEGENGGKGMNGVSERGTYPGGQDPYREPTQ